MTQWYLFSSFTAQYPLHMHSANLFLDSPGPAPNASLAQQASRLDTHGWGAFHTQTLK